MAEGKTVRFRGAGHDMFLHVYIDGETMKAQVRTKCMFPQLSTFR